MFNREDIEWPSWGAPLRARLGGWLLNLVCETTGWFTKELSLKVSQNSHSSCLLLPMMLSRTANE